MHLYVDYVIVNSCLASIICRPLPDHINVQLVTLTLIMVTTRAGHAKKILGAELDDDDGDNHDMYLEDLFDNGTNHGLSLEDVQARAIEQALMQCADSSGSLAKACIESIFNPPPPFESDDDEVAHDAHNYRDKSVVLVPRTNVTEYTPPNTDQTLPVPTAVKAIMAEDICRQQYPHAFLAELDEEMRTNIH
jgi:hypothetical protein